MSAILKVLGLLAALYLLLVTLAWRYQERLAFPAPRARLPDPSDLGIAGGRAVAVETTDGVMLRGWYLPPDPLPRSGATAPGLIWFYGNMETIAAMAPIIRDYRLPGTALVVLDYRGYGESGGTPTEEGIYRDADAAWAFLVAQPEVDRSRIAVYARSVGAVPGLYLATSHPVQGVVLDSPFTSARDMAARHYAWLPGFVTRLSLDNLARAALLQAPLLVLHGSEDAIAPLSMGRAIADAGRGELRVLEGVGHNDTYNVDDDLYRNPVREFLMGQLGETGKGKGER